MMKRKNEKGFTIMELLIVVAIIGAFVAIAIPAFAGKTEKSREATDLANVRSAYAELMTKVLTEDEATEIITVKLNQKVSDWQTKLPITIGGVTFNGTNTANWIGTPGSNGTCEVSYDEDKGAIFTWSGGQESSGDTPKPTYSGDLKGTKITLEKAFSERDTENMQNGKAFFSRQTFVVNGTTVTARVYYADSAAFKDSLASSTPKPASYEQSPFYSLEAWHGQNQTQGFAYYIYGDDGSIKELTYVNESKVYRTTDEGKTWYDITP